MPFESTPSSYFMSLDDAKAERISRQVRVGRKEIYVQEQVLRVQATELGEMRNTTITLIPLSINHIVFSHRCTRHTCDDSLMFPLPDATRDLPVS